MKALIISKWRTICLLILSCLILGVIGAVSVTEYVERTGSAQMVQKIQDAPEYGVAIVLGARVFSSGQLSPVLQDRVDTAVDLYRQGKVKKLLLTGDHGQQEYDEVNNMRRYALESGVNPEDIFMDHAGFSTYESMYRAKEIFQINQALIVTQAFHLPRALYIAQSMGLEVKGVSADRRDYQGIQYQYNRERLARVKAFLQTDVLHAKPTYLGEAIPITGDGRVTNDLTDDVVPVIQ